MKMENYYFMHAFLRAFKNLLMVGLLSLCFPISLVQAQVEQGAEKADAEAKKQAPAQSYTKEQMIERLWALATGPAPTREELEKEFGFTFLEKPLSSFSPEGRRGYSARVPYAPFKSLSDDRDRNANYRTLPNGMISLSFEFEDNYSRSYSKTKEYRMTLGNERLLKYLKNPPWIHKRKPAHNSMHSDLNWFESEIGSVHRRLELSFYPGYLSYFSVTYTPINNQMGEDK